MKPRLTFYLFIAAMTILDAVLIRSPNFLGQIGLLIYKYHYLRTFPKALLTISLVVFVAAIFSEAIRYTVRKELLKPRVGKMLFFFLTTLSAVLAIKVGLDFSSGSYAHTGLRFRLGATLLPVILVLEFIYGWLTLPKVTLPFPEFHPQREDDQASIK